MVSIDEFVIVIRADTSEASEALRTLNANTSALNRTMDDYQRGFEALQETVELLGDTEVNISPNFDGGDTTFEYDALVKPQIDDTEEDDSPQSIEVDMPELEPQEINVNFEGEDQEQLQQAQEDMQEMQQPVMQEQDTPQLMSEEQQPSEINVEMQSPQQDVNVEEGDKINENITDIERNAGDQINVDRGDNVLEAGDIEQNVNFESPQVPDITEQNVSPHIEQTLSQQIDSPLPDMEEDLEESIPDVQQPTETFIPPSPEEELNVPTEFELPTIPSQETAIQTPTQTASDIAVERQETEVPEINVPRESTQPQSISMEQPEQDVQQLPIQNNEQDGQELIQQEEFPEINIETPMDVQSVDATMQEGDFNFEANPMQPTMNITEGDIINEQNMGDVNIDTPTQEARQMSIPQQQEEMFQQRSDTQRPMSQEEETESLITDISNLISKLSSMDFEAPFNTPSTITEENLANMMYNARKYQGDEFTSLM